MISIVMGSKSDLPVMQETAKQLKEFGIAYEIRILSAHRAPEAVIEYAGGAEERGVKVIIAAAGMAAHLAGVCAAKSCLPVIGVPMDAAPLKGIDSLLSTVQMPAGVPVATVAIGKAGAKNAAILAAQILGVGDPEIRDAIRAFKKQRAEAVLKDDQEVREGAA